MLRSSGRKEPWKACIGTWVLDSPFERQGNVRAPEGGVISQLSNMGCTLGMAGILVGGKSVPSGQSQLTNYCANLSVSK